MNRQALITALARHAGQPLTVEVGREIMRELFPEQPIDIAQFQPLEHNGYVIRAERFADCLRELHWMHEQHWLETEGYRHGLALNPNYPEMGEHERAGRLLQLTVRKDDLLVGHLRLYIPNSLHTQTLYAEEDSLFFLPAFRGGFTVMKLLHYAEDCIRAMGVYEIRVHSKLANRADVLMKRMGYTAVALQHVKFLKRPGSTPLPRGGENAQHDELCPETASLPSA